MSRALRRHPPAGQSKKGRGAAPLRPVRRPGAGRGGPSREGRSGLGAAAAWRPRFLTDIISELRKVAWPSRQDTVHLTFVVIVIAALVGATLGGIDIGFGWIIEKYLLR